MAANGLAITVPSAGGAVAFKFHNIDRNMQIELPLQIKITCTGSKPCFGGPPKPLASTAYTIKGKVPGDLITDLQAASLVGDPLYVRMNPTPQLWCFILNRGRTLRLS